MFMGLQASPVVFIFANTEKYGVIGGILGKLQACMWNVRS